MLDRQVDVEGKDDDNVLRFVYINSFFQAGIKSPMDDAVLKHKRPGIPAWASNPMESHHAEPKVQL